MINPCQLLHYLSMAFDDAYNLDITLQSGYFEKVVQSRAWHYSLLLVVWNRLDRTLSIIR